MSYYYPPNASNLNYASYPTGPDPDGVLMVANAANHTKGTYEELTAATSFTSNSVSIFTHSGTNAAGLQFLVDVAVGAGGAEVVIVPDTMVEEVGTSDSGKYGIWSLPIAIASGTRVACRCQCSTGSSAARLTMTAQGAGAIPGVASYVNYGSNTATSGGVVVDPGGTIDVKGAYAQITASTSAVIQAITLMNTNNGNTDPQLSVYCIDVATGAGGAEVVLLPGLRAGMFGITAGDGGPMNPHTQSYLTYIPASTRLSVRASCTINDATDRVFAAAILGATAPSESQGTNVSNKLSISSLHAVQNF